MSLLVSCLQEKMFCFCKCLVFALRPFVIVTEMYLGYCQNDSSGGLIMLWSVIRDLKILTNEPQTCIFC